MNDLEPKTPNRRLPCMRPGKAAFRGAFAREIIGPLICKLMGKRDDGYGPFRPGEAAALDGG